MIDEKGTQVGLVLLGEALRMAREKNLDLIQVTEKVDPPVCRIGDYGKYLYTLQKKEKAKSKKSVVLKGTRIRLNTSLHDLEIRARQAEKFLREGDRVKVELALRGREKGLSHLAEEKIKEFLAILGEKIQVKVENGPKKAGRGLTMIISKGKDQP